MDFERDPIKALGEDIEELLNDRIPSCGYYHSQEYRDNCKKSLELDRKIRKCLGEKEWKKIFKYSFEIDHLNGELQSSLSESCYRLGFEDALILAREMNQVGKGNSSIFD
ncbi:MAG: hypothetical protein NHB14_01440 [Desulfosporosinus sp.]|nr:hypothetical protein [Desulfosporosinus sp.]